MIEAFYGESTTMIRVEFLIQKLNVKENEFLGSIKASHLYIIFHSGSAKSAHIRLISSLCPLRRQGRQALGHRGNGGHT